jgi:hypothetical protein
VQVYGLGASRPRGSLGFRAGPVVRWTRHVRSSAGRGGAIIVIGFLSGLVGVAVQRGNALHGLLPGKVRAGSECLVLVARQIVLQVAVRDIGQLTYIEPRPTSRCDLSLAHGQRTRWPREVPRDRCRVR